jgi:hypothetical protein
MTDEFFATLKADGVAGVLKKYKPVEEVAEEQRAELARLNTLMVDLTVVLLKYWAISAGCCIPPALEQDATDVLARVRESRGK